MEQTLIIFKPDAVKRGLIGEILARFERKGFRISATKFEVLSDEKLNEHYAHHKDKPFFGELKKFMQSSPCLLMVLEGDEAVAVVRQMVGVTDGKKATPGTIRGDLCLSGSENIIHASDSPENAQLEIKRFFSDSEIF